MHLLLFIISDNHILNMNKIDDVVLTHILKLIINLDRSLIVIIKKFIIHNLCNQKRNINISCLVSDSDDDSRKCKKKFLKKFVNVTVFFKNSKYSIYY